MDDLALARALHVLAVLAWMGGVWFVTLVILPAIAATTAPEQQLPEFHRIEGRFAPQAMAWVLLAGASGFWMVWRMDLWWRFADAGFWWMWAMLLVWLVFMLILFVAEPLIIHPMMKRGSTILNFTRLRIMHVLLSLGGLVATFGAVAGAHGWMP